MNFVKKFLNSITMYRLVLWSLVLMVVWAFGMAIFGFGAYGIKDLGISLVILVVVCYGVNWLLASLWRVSRNVESALITALILFFVMLPASTTDDMVVLAIAGGVAMVSKYLLAWRGKHVFNPAAFAALFTGILFSGLAIWWVGSAYFLPISIVVMALIFSKLRRWHMFWAFLVANVATLCAYAWYADLQILTLLETTFKSWPLLFFAGVMLSEPITTPPHKRNQILYAVLVGVLAGWPFMIGPFYGSPELALLVGNLFSFAVSCKKRFHLKLVERIEMGDDVVEMVFETNKSCGFEAGQYMEWTLGHRHVDDRGNRRFFTIASSPTEEEVRLGVKFYDNSSSFKNKLKGMKAGETLWAGQIDGDFVLPRDEKAKICFIAGGIGITPFISQLRYLMDVENQRSIIMLYGNDSYQDIAYRDLLEKAEQELDFRVVHVLSRDGRAPKGLDIEEGRISEAIIRKRVEDFKDRVFYISGPSIMVDAFKHTLKSMGVPARQIRSDYFPGFA